MIPSWKDSHEHRAMVIDPAPGHIRRYYPLPDPLVSLEQAERGLHHDLEGMSEDELRADADRITLRLLYDRRPPAWLLERRREVRSELDARTRSRGQTPPPPPTQREEPAVRRRIMVPTKNNLAIEAAALAYYIEAADESCRVAWDGPTEHTADAVLDGPRADAVGGARFCGEFVEQRGREIQHGCGLSSTSVTIYNLRKLRAAGAIDWVDGNARTIRVLPPGATRDPGPRHDAPLSAPVSSEGY